MLLPMKFKKKITSFQMRELQSPINIHIFKEYLVGLDCVDVERVLENPKIYSSTIQPRQPCKTQK